MTNIGVLINSSDSSVMTRSRQAVLPDRPPGADDHADHGAQHRADDQQPQADPDAAPQFVGDRLAGDRRAEVAVHRTRRPVP